MGLNKFIKLLRTPDTGERPNQKLCCMCKDSNAWAMSAGHDKKKNLICVYCPWQSLHLDIIGLW